MMLKMEQEIGADIHTSRGRVVCYDSGGVMCPQSYDLTLQHQMHQEHTHNNQST